jgi:hypothetical protein
VTLFPPLFSLRALHLFRESDCTDKDSRRAALLRAGRRDDRHPAHAQHSDDHKRISFLGEGRAVSFPWFSLDALKMPRHHSAAAFPKRGLATPLLAYASPESSLHSFSASRQLVVSLQIRPHAPEASLPLIPFTRLKYLTQGDAQHEEQL